jgi:hypothetical protein
MPQACLCEGRVPFRLPVAESAGLFSCASGGDLENLSAVAWECVAKARPDFPT